ncbi:diacylglycerol/lipid kinase family protein [Occultella gossypii]|uniref:Diacylglycerol kinase n=1 Tax=Occultella gossypii TaxID=2800820 RepID=A0ABS7SGP1_9MICO|nr:diacylglycerol kinase family protein [Occultella gossypii]MBZ2199372.1 diacylglycerol kinase [Occultella gossypii]
MTWEQVVSVVALVLAVTAVVVGLVLLRRISERNQRVPSLGAGTTEPTRPTGPPAFVVNPIKVTDPRKLRTAVEQVCADAGLPEPLWYETTVADPGLGQARRALADGASVVVAAGGDGTVRAVAMALVGTSTPMGLLPLGTGNLLARNLDLPVDGTRSLIRTALTGTDHPIDIGWVRPDRLRPAREDQPGSGSDAAIDPAVDPEEDEHLFLVMAGVGFDAAMVAGAGDELKARVGWFAYFLAGARHLHGRKVRLRMTVDEAPGQHLRLRSLLFANCGRLPGGIVLLPDAQINDGWLDIAALDTRGGLFGWASLFGQVVGQGIGIRRQLPNSPSTIEFWRGKQVRVLIEEPAHVQVDGDLIGEAVGLRVRVEPAGLYVRTNNVDESGSGATSAPNASPSN